MLRRLMAVLVLAIVLVPGRGRAQDDGAYEEVLRLGRGSVTGFNWHPTEPLAIVNTTTGAYLHRAPDLAEVAALPGWAGAAFSPDGRWLYGSVDGGYVLRAADRPNRPNVLTGLAWLHFNPTGDLLLTAPVDGGPLTLRRSSDLAALPMPAALTPPHTYATWNANGRRLALWEPGVVYLWTVGTRTPQQTIRLPRAAVDVEWSPGGDKLLTVEVDGRLNVYRTQDGALLNTLEPENVEDEAYSFGAAWHANNRDVLRYRWHENPYDVPSVVTVYDALTNQVRGDFRLEGYPGNVVFSTDGRWLMLGRSVVNAITYEIAYYWDLYPALLEAVPGVVVAGWATVRVIDLTHLEAGEEVLLEVPVEASRVFAASPNGDHLLKADGRGAIVLWDVAAQRVVARNTSYTLYSVDTRPFDQDSDTIVVTTQDGELYFIQQSTGSMIAQHTLSPDAIHFVEPQPRGGHVATMHAPPRYPYERRPSAEDESSVRIWERHTGKQIAALHFPNRVGSLEWSADGRYLAIHHRNRLYVWDANTRGYASVSQLILVPDYGGDVGWSANNDVLWISYSSGTHGARTLEFFTFGLHQRSPTHFTGRIDSLSHVAWNTAQGGIQIFTYHCREWVDYGPDRDCDYGLSKVYPLNAVPVDIRGYRPSPPPKYIFATHIHQPAFHAWNPLGTQLVVWNDTTLWGWSTATSTPTQLWSLNGIKYNANRIFRNLEWSPDGHYLLLHADTGQWVIAGATGDIVWRNEAGAAEWVPHLPARLRVTHPSLPNQPNARRTLLLDVATGWSAFVDLGERGQYLYSDDLRYRVSVESGVLVLERRR